MRLLKVGNSYGYAVAKQQLVVKRRRRGAPPAVQISVVVNSVERPTQATLRVRSLFTCLPKLQHHRPALVSYWTGAIVWVLMPEEAST